MRFPAYFIDEVLAHTDIVSLIGEYMTLKQSGREYKGLCPFHGEKTPSFSVSQEKNVYHCFGCGAGGGAINFVMEAESLHYGEAVEFLARRAGLALPQMLQYDDSKERALQNKILAINKETALFYYHCLHSDTGKVGMEYLLNRGLSPQTLKQFAIGFAPDAWDTLIKFLEGKGYGLADLSEAGLISQSKKTGQMYDSFRNRIIFPIVNLRKEVIGFGGRIMDDSKPKYINSPDTAVYNKSKNLFGLNLAKKSRESLGILTEGPMDAIALHQAGFTGAVATMGTAFTSQQGQLMKRYFKNTVICYDNDPAGKSATQRAIPLFETAGVEVRVAEITDAKDPDEFIKAHGRDSFAHLLKQSVHHVDYRLALMKESYQLDDNGDKVRFLQETAKFLSNMESPIQQEIYATKVGDWLSVSKEAVLQEIKKEMEKKKRQAIKKIEKNSINPVVPQQVRQQSLYDVTRASRGEEGLLRVILSDGNLLNELQDFTEEVFSVPLLGKVFTLLKQRHQEGLAVKLPSLAEDLNPVEMKYLVSVFDRPLDNTNLQNEMLEYLAVMESEYDKRNLQGDEKLLALQRQMTEE
ncbi:MAG: DNA primase [Eubacteriales bacterium]